MSISAVLISALLALLFVCSGAMAQNEEQVCHYTGQTYQFSSTPCDPGWEYKWVTYEWSETLNKWVPIDDTFEGGIDNTCSINWIAPPATAEKDFKLAVTVYNNETYGQMLASCIAMDNITVTVCPLANITVIKDADPNDPAQEFDFVIDGVDILGGTFIEQFGLKDDGTNSGNNWTNNTLLPGTYIINEATLYCWNLTNITCTGNASVEFGNGSIFHDEYTAGDKSVNITLDPGEVSICTFTNTKKEPAINVTKRANYSMDNPIPSLGTNITYWINVTNVGEVTLDPVKINDSKLGLDLTLPDPLEPGESENLTRYYVVETEDDMCSGIVNTVVVNGTGCGEEVSDEDTWLISAIVDGNYTVTKTADKSSANVGETINYTIKITNTGNMNITKINVTDTLTSGSGIYVTEFTPFPTIDCLTPGETRDLYTDYTVKLDDVGLDDVGIGKTIENIVEVTAVGPCEGLDINKEDNWTVDTDFIFDVRKIALQKTVKRCDEITYLIQIKSGEGVLENVTVKDVFNKPVEFISASPMPD
ncbi:MAG TPA: DUF11 domain-containing protein, partial [Methanotrichaceae archaeon]|nr:DUF11 domain-containing protein [Methanotrichaceae archaeon]